MGIAAVRTDRHVDELRRKEAHQRQCEVEQAGDADECPERGLVTPAVGDAGSVEVRGDALRQVAIVEDDREDCG
jgi:hypothetical protein